MLQLAYDIFASHFPTKYISKGLAAGWIGLKPFPWQMLWEKLQSRLELFWIISLANPLRAAWAETAAGLEHFPEAEAGLIHLPLQIFWQKLDWRLKLLREMFIHRSFVKSLIGSRRCFMYFSVHIFEERLNRRPQLTLQLFCALRWRCQRSNASSSWQSQLKAKTRCSKFSSCLQFQRTTQLVSLQKQHATDSIS